ncbi:MAG: hypothetical protein QY318_02705 [Candidatus Dojkabacteria bacterium]|nr:MAG: hypothetical protein QY318_02705 [Candidatus Dojkabacteria bacterium]
MAPCEREHGIEVYVDVARVGYPLREQLVDSILTAKASPGDLIVDPLHYQTLLPMSELSWYEKVWSGKGWIFRSELWAFGSPYALFTVRFKDGVKLELFQSAYPGLCHQIHLGYLRSNGYKGVYM